MAKDTPALTPVTPVVPAKRSLVDLAREKKVPDLVLAGVKGLRRWDDLYPVTEAELDAAVQDYRSITMS